VENEELTVADVHRFMQISSQWRTLSPLLMPLLWLLLLPSMCRNFMLTCTVSALANDAVLLANDAALLAKATVMSSILTYE
jgi:hypothetical protein